MTDTKINCQSFTHHDSHTFDANIQVEVIKLKIDKSRKKILARKDRSVGDEKGKYDDQQVSNV